MSDDSNTEFGQVISEDGSFAEGWMEKLPEDLRGDETLKSLPDFPAMAKMLVSSQKLVGKDKIIIPGKESTDDDWKEVFSKLGRPEESTGYELAKPEGFPEDEPWSEESVTVFKGVAHELDLLPRQAKGLFDWYNGVMMDVRAADKKAKQEQMDAGTAAVKKEWGAAYDQKTELADNAIRAFTTEEEYNIISDDFKHRPEIRKLFAKIGESISESKLKGVGQVPSKTEAQGEINKILGDSTHPYHIAKHPEHAAAVRAVHELFLQVDPPDEKGA